MEVNVVNGKEAKVRNGNVRGGEGEVEVASRNVAVRKDKGEGW